MRASLMSLNESIWTCVVTSWDRLEGYMTTNDKKAYNVNNKELNPIFTTVSPDEFRRILNVVNAKEAWGMSRPHFGI
jgi:hypothetical protein